MKNKSSFMHHSDNGNIADFQILHELWARSDNWKLMKEKREVKKFKGIRYSIEAAYSAFACFS